MEIPGSRLPQLKWRKARRSNASGNCVEMARLPHGGGYAIRNSRDPEGPALVFTPAEMTAFVAGVREGDFDDLVAGFDGAASNALGGSAGALGGPAAPGAGAFCGLNRGAASGAGEPPPARTK